MKKFEKGILGYRKDPKNQFLFTFTARKGEEWPSDSEDSDYEPTKEEAKEINIKVKKKKKNSVKKRKKLSSDSEDSDYEPTKEEKKDLNIKVKKRQKRTNEETQSQNNKEIKKETTKATTSSSRTCRALPVELWLKIFKFYVDNYGALPFLCRASKVCRLWNEVALDPVLWRKIDLSYGWIKSTERTLLWLCDNRLSQCQDISLSNWKDLSGNVLKVMGEKCPNLRSVNLSYCKKINPESFTSLVDNCRHLCALDLSFTNVPVSCIKYVVQTCNTRMTQLSVAGNKMVGFNTVLNTILMCPNLQLLDLSNATFTSDFVTFNIEKIQEACPRLKVLRLTNSKFRAADVSLGIQDASEGFPDLQEISLGVSSDRNGFQSNLCFNDRFLTRVLKKSYNLKLLDLRGNSEVTAQGILSLPATDVELLFLSKTDGSKFNSLAHVLEKWADSLLELDLSWTVYSENKLEEALDMLIDWPIPKSKLKSLNLAGTSVRAASVKRLLENCLDLRYINLTSCRGLPRGMKREYNKSDWKLLRRELNQIDLDSD